MGLALALQMDSPGRAGLRRRNACALVACVQLLAACGGGGPTEANRPPVVAISSPADGAQFSKGENVIFEGTASDPEDGPLAGSSLQWSSSIDGALGSGATLTRTNLSAGNHVLTLHATDAHGLPGQAVRSIKIVVMPSAATSVVQVSTATIASGATSGLTLIARAQDGSLVSAGGAAVVFLKTCGTSNGTIGPTSDAGDGTYTAVFTGTAAGAACSIGATLNGVSVTTPQPTITVVPGPPSPSTSQLTVSTSVISAGDSAILSLQARDAFGNPLTGGGAIVVFTRSGGTSVGTISTTSDRANGTYAAVYHAQGAGSANTIGATVNGTPVAGSLPTVSVSPGVIAPSAASITVSSASIASGNSGTLTLRAKDAFGNALAAGGAVVLFSASGGTSSGTISSTTDHGDGSYTASFTARDAGSALVVGATVNGLAVTSSLPGLVVVPGSISPASSVISVSRSSIVAGDTAVLSLVGKDAVGNAVAIGGARVVFAATGGISTGSIGVVSDHANGTYTALFVGQHAGSPATINASINGFAVSTTLPLLSVGVGAVSTVQSLIQVSTGTVASGSTGGITLLARDVGGNDIPSGGLSVGFGLGAGNSAGTIGLVTDNGDGTYSAVFVGTIAGSPRTVTATINGQALTSAPPTLTVVAGPPVSFGLSTALVILAPGGNATVGLAAQDLLGNQAPTVSATLVSRNMSVVQATGSSVFGNSIGVTELVASLGSLSDTMTVVVADSGNLIAVLGSPGRDTVIEPQVPLRLDYTLDASRASPQSLGSFTFTIATNPQVLRLDSVSTAAVHTLVVNMTAASVGMIVIGGFEATGIPAHATLFRVWVTPIGLPGDRARVSVLPTDLTETSSLVNLIPMSLLPDSRIRIR
jgi:hypothetical protein